LTSAHAGLQNDEHVGAGQRFADPGTFAHAFIRRSDSIAFPDYDEAW